jgi:hypothetical protein
VVSNSGQACSLKSNVGSLVAELPLAILNRRRASPMRSKGDRENKNAPQVRVTSRPGIVFVLLSLAILSVCVSAGHMRQKSTETSI